MSLEEELARGIAALGLDLPPGAQPRLLAYLALLEKWNRVHNLTAVRDPQQMVTQHLLDSLAVLPHIAGPRVADVGSGGGLPGIPLAMARPDWSVALVESSAKKAAFLRQAAIELSLANVTVVGERVEAWRPARGFDTVISRAFSDLAEFARLASHLVAPGGALAAMKGVYPDEEIAQLPANARVAREVALAVPGLDARRHLILLRPATEPAASA